MSSGKNTAGLSVGVNRISFSITGKIPSKKNSKRIFRRKDGTPFITSSKNHTEWLKYAVQEFCGHKAPEGACAISVEFYAGDKRAFDLSNKFESIADALVDAGVISDDNYHILSEVHLVYRGYTKGVFTTNITIY